MLLKYAAKSAVGWMLLVAVLPSLLLNVGPNRSLLIHDHDHEKTHAHVIDASMSPEQFHLQEDTAAAAAVDVARGGGHSDIVIIGSNLTRPRHLPATEVPVIIHAFTPSVIINSATLPVIQCNAVGMGAGPPNVSLASQTCVQILI